jgi:hypothetical protein
MTASDEQDLPTLLADGFLVRLTSSKELTAVDPAIPLIAVSFRGRYQDDEVATWSIVLDHDQARDLANILTGAIAGLNPTTN